jgi:hypothetical protein
MTINELVKFEEDPAVAVAIGGLTKEIDAIDEQIEELEEIVRRAQTAAAERGLLIGRKNRLVRMVEMMQGKAPLRALPVRQTWTDDEFYAKVREEFAGEFSVRDTQYALGISYGTAKRHLLQLVERGDLIVAVRGGQGRGMATQFAFVVSRQPANSGLAEVTLRVGEGQI